MKKQLVSLVLAMIFGLSLASASMAAIVTCTVKSIDENTVVLDCGDKTGELQVGDKVKVRPPRRAKAVEGC